MSDAELGEMSERKQPCDWMTLLQGGVLRAESGPGLTSSHAALLDEDLIPFPGPGVSGRQRGPACAHTRRSFWNPVST